MSQSAVTRLRQHERLFWLRVGIEGDCWVWRGTRARNGYGLYWLHGNRRRRAHRMAWELVNGPVPSDLDVCHHCDNRLCVRPAHLFVGTRKDNMQDMLAKGRGAYGERHPSRRLTVEAVRDIRLRVAAGASMRMVAREYGMSNSAVQKVVLRQSWKAVA